LLKAIVDRQISVRLPGCRLSIRLAGSGSCGYHIKLLSKTAVEVNLASVVDELSRTQALGILLLSDLLQDIPEARPVLRLKVIL